MTLAISSRRELDYSCRPRPLPASYPHTQKNKRTITLLPSPLICANVALVPSSPPAARSTISSRANRSVLLPPPPPPAHEPATSTSPPPHSKFMGPRPESPRAEQQAYRFPPSPASSSSSPTPLRLSFDAPQSRDRQSFLQTPARRPSSHKLPLPARQSHDFYNSGSDGSNTETKQGRISPQLHRRKTARKKSDRALTLPSSRTAPADLGHAKTPTSARPLSRRSSSASSSSSSGAPAWTTPQPSTSGIGRKVAASLDLFKESATTPVHEDANPFECARSLSAASRHRNGSSHQLNVVGEPQFEFVKRSDWPDREAAAIRREKSTTAFDRERDRTRESFSSVSSTREDDNRRRKERQASVRDMRGDLAQWRRTVADQDGRGRPRERPGRPEDKAEETIAGSPDTDSSVATLQDKNDRTVSSSPFRHPPSIDAHSSSHGTSSHVDSVSPVLPSSLFVPAPEHEVPPPVSIRRARSRSLSPPPTSPLPFTLLPSTLISQPSTSSPWSSEDEDDSAWESASVATTSSTTSASSPFPLSPSRTSPLPQPLVRHPSDEDDEHNGDSFAPYRHAGMVPDEAQDELSMDWSLNLSQESLPHIPLRPFRNQVGGHSAIYKFTKRAVCKVRSL